MRTMETLTEISEKYNGVIETKVAVQHGVSRATLSMYCKQNKLKRIHYGVYMLAEKETDKYFYLSGRSERFVFSHETALYLHRMQTEEPVKPSVTVSSGITPSVMFKSLCEIYYIRKDLTELGKITVRSPEGNEVPVYDLERTVCDMVRSVKRVGEEKALAAVREYFATETADREKLFAYAQKFHITSRMKSFREKAAEK